MKRLIFFLLIVTGIITFSAAQTADHDLRQEGIASWYGKEFEGRPTASGEIFDPGQYTAAHLTLPFGTLITVTNKQNMRQVTVKINDRGPFVAARIIDLSRAAAEVLDMVHTGTAPIVIERAQTTALGPVNGASAPVIAAAPVVEAAPVIVPAPVEVVAAPVIVPAPVEVEVAPVVLAAPVVETAPVDVAVPAITATPVIVTELHEEPVRIIQGQSAQEIVNIPQNIPQTTVFYPAPAARILGGIPPAESLKSYRLQVGAFLVPRNAVDAFEKLKSVGLNPAYEQNGEYYRVVLAGLRAAEIPEIAQTLGNSGFREALIREEY